MTRAVPVVVLALALAAAATAGGEQARRDPPLIDLEATAGRESFERHCAACHGDTGGGDGPIAAELRSNPPDLRTLSRRNGVVPGERLRQILEGRGVPAHGNTEMPVWGQVFVREPGGDAESARRASMPC